MLIRRIPSSGNFNPRAPCGARPNETDDNVFMKKTFLYGVDSRGNAGFGFWQMAYAGDGTAEA